MSLPPHVFIQDPTKDEPICFLCGGRKEFHVVFATPQPEKKEK
jgi:hypothetical protein